MSTSTATPPPLTFTREQLYEKVWEVSTVKLAKSIGCSYPVLIKICQKHDVPKPYLGYWARLQLGQELEKTPLPINNDPEIQVIAFHQKNDEKAVVKKTVVEVPTESAEAAEPTEAANPTAATDPETLTFTRKQLYEKLWEISTAKVAKIVGCSDVMIGKICKTHDIPKPYLGYWSRIQCGQDPDKTPLPENNDPKIQTITFHQRPGEDATLLQEDDEGKYDADIRDMLEKARSLPPVPQQGALLKPHLLVAKTRTYLTTKIKAPSGLEYVDRSDPIPILDVRVDDKHLARALRIMDVLIKRMEDLGFAVEFEKHSWRERWIYTVLKLAGQKVTAIRIREKLARVQIPPEKGSSWGARSELESTGLLILDDSGTSYPPKVFLQDSPKKRRVEDGINEFIIDLIKEVGDRRIEMRQKEEERKRRQAEEQIRLQREAEIRAKREDLLRRQKKEQNRVDQFVHEANSWQQSKVLRDYLEAVRNMVVKRDGAIEPNSEANRFLTWATQQADRLDPLTHSPPSILDEETDPA